MNALVSVIDGLRQVLGAPSVYVDGVIDYGLLAEYIVAAAILYCVVRSIFGIVVRAFER